MGTCETCKYWESQISSYVKDVKNECKNVDARISIYVPDGEGDFEEPPYFKMETPYNFGCNQYEAK